MSTDIVQYDEIQAMSHGPFRATTIGLVVTEDDVPYELWEAYGGAIRRVEGAIQWIIGDWLNYGERKYGETYAQAMDETDMEYQALANYKWVAGQVEFSTRVENLSWTHHREVANMEPEEQEYWLNEAVEQGYTVRGLREAIRDERLIAAPPLPVGKYQVLYADPPWQYSNSGFEESAESQYPTMPMVDICQMEIAQLCAPETVLFLWATNPLLPDAMLVLDAWGFEYKTNIAWVKDRGRGKGWYLKSKHELLLIGTKPNTPHPRQRPDSCFEAERGSVHSRKPEMVYDIIESMYGGPYVELFARESGREGWSSWGNEV